MPTKLPAFDVMLVRDAEIVTFVQLTDEGKSLPVPKMPTVLPADKKIADPTTFTVAATTEPAARAAIPTLLVPFTRSVEFDTETTIRFKLVPTTLAANCVAMREEFATKMDAPTAFAKIEAMLVPVTVDSTMMMVTLSDP